MACPLGAKGCSIDSGFCNNTTHICNGEYKKIHKSMINTILNNKEKYEILHNILLEIQNNSNIQINNSLDTKIILDDKFKKNAMLMDFKMIPNELKLNMELLFNEII